ncbi:CapA family protein [Cohnella fermenti]|uniref:CapA family protein n=1 Tax=Cohnella fermenti TaxID=2565925 RepID=A0A4S4BHM2_9BACL|nr:CapA family protein [Cohnella fermenti]THF74053.1 CapA family protein [Cohnella fermenti]
MKALGMLLISLWLAMHSSLATTALSSQTHAALSVANATADVAADVEEEPAPEPPITVNLVGDILLADSIDSYIRKYGVDFPFKRTADVLADADITFGNLETSVSTRGKPANKQFTFRSRPESLEGLVNAGFDGVGLANNHSLDYGFEALDDTIANVRRYGLGLTGAGQNNDEAFAPYVQEVRGKKVAIVGISRVLPEASWYSGKNKPGIAHGYSLEPMMTYVKQAVEQADYTIVFIHWNKEREDYPEEYAREYARAFIDAGADAVIGAHSHCLQGIEWYKGKPVFYSLGNFVFTSKTEKSSDTMIVKLSLSDAGVAAAVTPAKIVSTQPRLMDDEYNRNTYAKLNKLSFNAEVQGDGTVAEKQD